METQEALSNTSKSYNKIYAAIIASNRALQSSGMEKCHNMLTKNSSNWRVYFNPNLVLYSLISVLYLVYVCYLDGWMDRKRAKWEMRDR